MESHVTVKGQPLSDASQDEGRVLTERLRALRRRTGLSLAGLAAVTPFSKSTWHRYLNGDQFPPRAAVVALGRLAEAEPGPLLALWDAAARAQAEGPVTVRQPPVPAPAVRPRGLRRPSRAVVALAAMAATVAVTAGAADVLDSDPAAAPRTAASCHGGDCQGELPTSETCDRDARTESSVTRAAEAVLLRFSPSCGTVWSELRTRTGGAREISIRSGQDELSAQYPGDRSDGYNSPMLATPDPHGAQACAEVAGTPACTGRYGAHGR
ncbi:DUF2690 domain-containing protein [Streptomyces sp. NPDC005648]|uniref:helix-turn-helix domain-containing protein n=1 Tax=Streptomyces sp. NPDC005648 TaxID=3157044 RepID=UPI0033BD0821